MLKDIDKKSKSAVLRSVLFKLHEVKPEKHEYFEDYYEYYMDKLINHFKNKIDEH